jgi:hypothetical protein
MTAPRPLTIPGLRYESGLLVQDAAAPSLAELRPLVPAAPGVFPVYPDLQERFLAPADPLVDDDPGGADRVLARTLAVCAGYAYSDAETVSTMMARMGFAGNRCRMIAMVDDAMFIVSTSFVVQSEDGRVVLVAYRGTEPVNLVNWLTDADLSPTPVRLERGNLPALAGEGAPLEIHGGFYRNVRATRYKVMQTLARAAAGIAVTAAADDDTPTVAPLEALYLTGHSLGAGMAAIAAMLLQNTPEHVRLLGERFRAAYTFAQPMVGNPALADACDAEPALADRVFRFVYEKDPVPHLPSREAGPYRNFGVEYAYDGRTWARRDRPGQAQQMWFVAGFLGSGVLSLVRYLPGVNRLPAPYLLDDHRPDHYIEALSEPGELTEFGDDVYA